MELGNLAQKLPEKIKTVWRQGYAIAILIFLIASIGAAILFYFIDVSVWWSAIGFAFTIGYFILTFFCDCTFSLG
ncbi:hypothetical protein PROCOU_14998 [Listeria rocourtiae FSL F6-920]|nr:hypothetical protein PROCOU_14998 [Listeria rocourtiae FSL F6-920]